MTLERAARILPAFLLAGLFGGVLLGLFLDNLPNGIAAGMIAAPLAWAALVAGRRRGKDV
ncbi:MAG TPA: hypothetical protein VK019_00675 [Pseudomonas sp.]|nr:hypothetical protein [Pseudomonas sp.]